MGLLSRWFERGVFVFVAVLLLFLGLVQGFQVQNFTVDLFFVVFEVLWVEAVFSSILFTGFFVLSGGIFLFKLLNWSPSDGEVEGSVVAVVPSYRDSEVLHRSVESLLDSEHDDLKVLIICEEDDSEGIEEAERLSKKDRVDVLVNDRFSRSWTATAKMY